METTDQKYYSHFWLAEKNEQYSVYIKYDNGLNVYAFLPIHKLKFLIV